MSFEPLLLFLSISKQTQEEERKRERDSSCGSYLFLHVDFRLSFCLESRGRASPFSSSLLSRAFPGARSAYLEFHAGESVYLSVRTSPRLKIHPRPSLPVCEHAGGDLSISSEHARLCWLASGTLQQTPEASPLWSRRESLQRRRRRTSWPSLFSDRR